MKCYPLSSPMAQSETLLSKVYPKYTMDITTIKLQKKTKSELDKIKQNQETYDEIIQRLVEEGKKKSRKKELIEGYSQIGKKELKEIEEWEAATLGDEEWK